MQRSNKKLVQVRDFQRFEPYEHNVFRSLIGEDKKSYDVKLNTSYDSFNVEADPINKHKNFKHTQFTNIPLLNRTRVEYMTDNHYTLSDEYLKLYKSLNKTTS